MKAKQDLQDLHDILDIHEWTYFAASDLSKHEKAVSNNRRMCEKCGKVQWSYGAEYAQHGNEEWNNDGSALARVAIEKVQAYRKKATEFVEAAKAKGINI